MNEVENITLQIYHLSYRISYKKSKVTLNDWSNKQSIRLRKCSVNVIKGDVLEWAKLFFLDSLMDAR